MSADAITPPAPPSRDELRRAWEEIEAATAARTRAVMAWNRDPTRENEKAIIQARDREREVRARNEPMICGARGPLPICSGAGDTAR